MRVALALSLSCAACAQVITHDVEDAGAVRYLQSACDLVAGASISVAFPGPNASRSLMVAALDFQSTGQSVLSVHDSSGNAWQPAFSLARTATGAAQTWYATAGDGGSNTVTVTLDAPSSGVALYVHEYAGVAVESPLEDTAVTTGSGAALRTGSASAAAGDLLFAHAAGVDTVASVGGMMTARESCNGNLTADGVAPAAGEHEVTFTGTASSGWAATLATYRREGASAGGRPLSVGCSQGSAGPAWAALVLVAMLAARETRRRSHAANGRVRRGTRR